MSPRFSFLVPLLLQAPLLFAQTETLDFSRLREQAAAGQWSSVLHSSQTFLRRWPASVQADDAEYLGIVARVETNQPQEALVVLRRFPRTYPQSPYVARLSYWQARSYAALSRRQEAAEALESYLELEPQGPFAGPAWLLLGEMREIQLDFRAAEVAYQRAAALLPWERQGDVATLARSRVLRRLGRSPEARSMLSRVLDRDSPRGQAIRLEYARLLRTLNEHRVAEGVYRALLGTQGSVGEAASVELFEYLVELRQDAEALEVLVHVPQEYRLRPRVKNLIAQLRKTSGQQEEARRLWKEVALQQADPESAQVAAWNLAVSLEDDAGEFLRWLEAAEKGPEQGLAHEARWRRSFLMEPKQQKDLLLSLVQKGLEGERLITAYQRLLNLARTEGDRTVLILALNALLRLDPTGPTDVYRYLRAEARRYSDPDLALQDLQDLLRETPRSSLRPQTFYLIGTLYSDRAEFLRAEGFFHSASQAASGELAELSLLARGIALINGGRKDTGVQVLKRLEREHPGSEHLGASVLLRAQALTRMGQAAEAEVLLNRVVSEFPGQSHQARLELGHIHLAAQRFDAASEWFTPVLADDRAREDWRIQALVGRTTALVRNWKFSEAQTILVHSLWNRTAETRAQRRYWDVLVTGGMGDWEAALRQAVDLVREVPAQAGVFLDLEGLPGTPTARRLRALESLAALFPQTEEAYQAALRKAVLYAAEDDAAGLGREVGRWLERWGSDPSRAPGARILVRLLPDLAPWEQGFRGSAAPVRAEYLLWRARQVADADHQGSASLLQIVFQSPSTRAQKEEASLVLADSALRRGNTAEARRLYETAQASEQAEVKAGAFLGLGLLEKQLGSMAEALRSFRTSSEQGPWEDSARALYEGVRLLREQGKTSEAETWEGRLRQNFPDSLWTRKLNSPRI